jgi:hypothetical protein
VCDLCVFRDHVHRTKCKTVRLNRCSRLGNAGTTGKKLNPEKDLWKNVHRTNSSNEINGNDERNLTRNMRCLQRTLFPYVYNGSMNRLLWVGPSAGARPDTAAVSARFSLVVPRWLARSTPNLSLAGSKQKGPTGLKHDCSVSRTRHA